MKKICFLFLGLFLSFVLKTIDKSLLYVYNENCIISVGKATIGIRVAAALKRRLLKDG